MTFLKFKLTFRLPADIQKLETIFERMHLNLPMVVLVHGNVHTSVNGYLNAFQIEIRNEDISSIQTYILTL
jgi:hypothetical protein